MRIGENLTSEDSSEFFKFNLQMDEAITPLNDGSEKAKQFQEQLKVLLRSMKSEVKTTEIGASPVQNVALRTFQPGKCSK